MSKIKMTVITQERFAILEAIIRTIILEEGLMVQNMIKGMNRIDLTDSQGVRDRGKYFSCDK